MKSLVLFVGLCLCSCLYLLFWPIDLPACLRACVLMFSLSLFVFKKHIFFTYRSIFLQFHVHIFLSHPNFCHSKILCLSSSTSLSSTFILSPLPLLYRLPSFYLSMPAYKHPSIYLSMHPRMSKKHRWPAPANLGIHSTNVNECLHV